MASKAYELLTHIKDLSLISGVGDDTKLLHFLNLVQWEIYNINFRWRGLETSSTVATVSGTASVTVPSTIGMIYDARLTTTSPYGKLTFIDLHKFHELVLKGSSPTGGSPSYYTWWADKLWLFPTPNAIETITIYGYLKPVSMKIYSTGTATLITTAATGTSTFFSNNSNVDTSMFIAIQADVRSDGTYPWSTITTITSNTALVISSYTGSGGGTTADYVCSSSLTLPSDFDELLILGTSIMYGTRLREFGNGLLEHLQKNYDLVLKGLIDSQTHFPDHSPLLDGYIPGPREVMGDSVHRLPNVPVGGRPQQ